MDEQQRMQNRQMATQAGGQLAQEAGKELQSKNEAQDKHFVYAGKQTAAINENLKAGAENIHNTWVVEPQYNAIRQQQFANQTKYGNESARYYPGAGGYSGQITQHMFDSMTPQQKDNYKKGIPIGIV